MDYAQRIHAIADAMERSGRRSERARPARLLAVSKTRTAAAVCAAHRAGLTDFGENYVQEALAKMAALRELDIAWHFIGAIQANKTRAIARHFHWVHTIDRSRIATRLDAAAERPLDVCIQVNIDAEPRKAGVLPNAVGALVAEAADLPRLRLRGLMAIPRPDGDSRASFRRMGELFNALAPVAGAHWDTLSMGMSADFETAIEEGATIVRIGTAIFGPRPAKPARAP